MPHVLIVDNDPDVREALATALEMAGAGTVTAASCAEDALGALARRRPDAAIIDAGLPKISGVALVRQFTDLGIPSLVISGDPEHLQHFTEARCPFLAKPFRLERLLTETRALLQEAEWQMARLQRGLDRLANNKVDLAKSVERSRDLLELARGEREARQPPELVWPFGPAVPHVTELREIADVVIAVHGHHADEIMEARARANEVAGDVAAAVMWRRVAAVIREIKAQQA